MGEDRERSRGQKEFAALDKNKDGFVDFKEYASDPAARAVLVKIFLTMDLNRDGVLTLRSQGHTTVIQVRNSKGSTTPVMLRQIGPNTCQGPRGEIYYGFPIRAQLRALYAM